MADYLSYRDVRKRESARYHQRRRVGVISHYPPSVQAAHEARVEAERRRIEAEAPAVLSPEEIRNRRPACKRCGVQVPCAPCHARRRGWLKLAAMIGKSHQWLCPDCPPEPCECMTCRSGVAVARGCCAVCYAMHVRDIRRGLKTWTSLVRKGLAAYATQKGGAL